MLFVKYFFELNNFGKIKVMILSCKNDFAKRKFLITDLNSPTLSSKNMSGLIEKLEDFLTKNHI